MSKERPRTFVEKLLKKKACSSNNDGEGTEQDVIVSQIVTVAPDHLLTHDNTSAIIAKISSQLEEFGICSTELPIIALDHVIPAVDEKIATGHKKIREFVKKYHVKHFFDVGTGVCHQLVVEKGLAEAGTIVVGSDSHTCTYGAVGCFSTGVDRTEAASLLLSGELWLKVPPTIKVVLDGKLQPGVFAKDVVIHIIGDISASGAAYSCIEFHGNGLEGLTVDDRMTISNMGVEMDCKGAVFPVDSQTYEYYNQHGLDTTSLKDFEWADQDAVYSSEVHYDLSKIEPSISKPHQVDNVVPVTDVVGTKIDQLYLGTCTNGRYCDLKIAAEILRGRKVCDSCRLLVCPASRSELEKALSDATIQTLVSAGATLLPSGCGPCLGAHQGILAPNEVCLSSANRNFKGRMGCRDSEIFLASPATIAASAIDGCIADPRPYFRVQCED